MNKDDRYLRNYSKNKYINEIYYKNNKELSNREDFDNSKSSEVKVIPIYIIAIIMFILLISVIIVIFNI